jgi:hypothetical protein
MDLDRQLVLKEFFPQGVAERIIEFYRNDRLERGRLVRCAYSSYREYVYCLKDTCCPFHMNYGRRWVEEADIVYKNKSIYDYVQDGVVAIRWTVVGRYPFEWVEYPVAIVQHLDLHILMERCNQIDHHRYSLIRKWYLEETEERNRQKTHKRRWFEIICGKH